LRLPALWCPLSLIGKMRGAASAAVQNTHKE
jgi:hypothetical protein